MFAVTGDLIDALELRATANDDEARSATMGGTLSMSPGASMRVELRVRVPASANHAGRHPVLDHVELIVGGPGGGNGPVMQTRVLGASDWQVDGAWRSVSWVLPVPTRGGFVRARGSSTAEVTPLPDVPGEDPWQDLWFYSNPVFVEAVR